MEVKLPNVILNIYRFDSLFVMRSIWELGLDVRSLIQGLGYLNITLVSENIVFTDSFKMLTQPLAQLPDRFYFNPKLSKGKPNSQCTLKLNYKIFLFQVSFHSKAFV